MCSIYNGKTKAIFLEFICDGFEEKESNEIFWRHSQTRKHAEKEGGKLCYLCGIENEKAC